MLTCKKKPVGEQACPADQSPFRRNSGKLWKIIAFRQMGQNHICGLPVVPILKIIGRCLVGKMSHA